MVTSSSLLQPFLQKPLHPPLHSSFSTPSMVTASSLLESFLHKPLNLPLHSSFSTPSINGRWIFDKFVCNCCLLNLNSGEIRYTKNGEDLGIAFKLDQSRKSDCYFPAVVLKNAEMSFNFGATPFKHTPPKDYVALCNAPKECVKLNVVSSVQSTDSKPVNNAPQAIIIEPSRELAEQTCNQITKFKKYLENPKVRELLVVGGINVKDQINQLNAGIDIVVGTPGRLEDLIQGADRAPAPTDPEDHQRWTTSADGGLLGYFTCI
ncbi:ATP-dependent RNA helicase DDX1 [Papilio machaon]|uniref:ATP-dependent RNA helicase n=1 Tax=Papilio machaon TaxID=76193 RepID=A0A0N0PFP9_PAPMA|nr:ATP-dependent RNA helicase DDX1 [Papilio machaon]